MNEAPTTYHLTGPMQRTQDAIGRPLRDELVERYQVRGQTFEQIGTDLGVSATTIHRWMRSLAIEARFPGQKGTAA